MPSVHTVQVGCTLTDPVILARVSDEIQRAGGRCMHLTRSDVLRATGTGRLAALVYDLEPGDASAVTFVRQIHAARPDWPVWLYYAPRARLIERVAEVAPFRGIWTTPQLVGSLHDDEIRVHVRRLLTSVPRAQLMRILGAVLDPLPIEVREFLDLALEHPDHPEPTRFGVRTFTGDVPGKIRHLERVCRAAEIPGPKRLLDHLTLVFVTFTTFRFDLPPASAAGQVGLSPKVLDGLRRRVLGADAQWAELEPRARFEFALMALAKACRVPQQIAEESVQRAISERLA